MAVIFDVLHEDHEQVAQLLKKIGSTSEKDLDAKNALIEEVQHELEVHMQFEEAEVYPAIEKALAEEGGLKHAVKEHKEAMQLLKGLKKSVAKGEGDWKSQLKELEAAIKHHVAEEENELFPRAREKVAKTTAEKLAAQYKATKKKMTPA